MIVYWDIGEVKLLPVYLSKENLLVQAKILVGALSKGGFSTCLSTTFWILATTLDNTKNLNR